MRPSITAGGLRPLVKAGFRVPIHATAGTLDLAEIVLRDAAKLQEEAENRWRRKHPDEAAVHDAELAREETALAAPEERREQPAEAAVRDAGRASEESALEDTEMPAKLRSAPAEGMTMTRAALYSIA